MFVQKGKLGIFIRRWKNPWRFNFSLSYDDYMIDYYKKNAKWKPHTFQFDLYFEKPYLSYEDDRTIAASWTGRDRQIVGFYWFAQIVAYVNDKRMVWLGGPMSIGKQDWVWTEGI